MSISQLWCEMSELVWNTYGVSSKLGRYLDRRAGIPLGKIHVLEFEMLGDEQPETQTASGSLSRFGTVYRKGGRCVPMSAEQHSLLGLELARAWRLLSAPLGLPKTHRRSVCQRRLRYEIETVRDHAERIACSEHGDGQAYAWYSNQREA